MSSKLWIDLNVDYICKSLYPSCKFLLELFLLLPLRVFLKMKSIKTRLLCISTEAPDEFSDTEYEFFADELVIILTLKNLFYVLYFELIFSWFSFTN